MNSDPDPFGFRPPRRREPNAQPITIIAQPGQEVRIVVPDTEGNVAGLPGDSRVSPKASGDSRVSPKASGDSRVSPRASGDSRVSPRASGDASGVDPFEYGGFRPAYSPTPITIVVRSGQEIRIMVPDGEGDATRLMADSRVSPKASGDSRVSPKASGDKRTNRTGGG